jgi:hypothetical protein
MATGLEYYAALIAIEASKEFGNRLGSAISDGVFGKSNETKAVEKELEKISTQLKEVLFYSRSTFSLLQNLPEMVGDIGNKQDLFNAYNTIESIKQVYISLDNWDTSIETFSSLAIAWNTIIAKESRIEQLTLLPVYADFLVIATKGRFYDAIIKGVEEKIETVEDYITDIGIEKLNRYEHEIKAHFQTQYVTAGKISEKSPFASWVMAANKTKTNTICFPSPRGASEFGRYCESTKSPDVVWNNAIVRINKRLDTLHELIEKNVKKLQSAVFVHETLKAYHVTLVARKDAAENLEKRNY